MHDDSTTASPLFSMGLHALTLGLCLLIAGCCGDPVPEGCKVVLEAPLGGTEVAMEGTVQGTVSHPDVQVYVLVHPTTAGRWWVQRIPAVSSSGAFKTTVYFGTKTQGPGEDFEIMALATCRRLGDGETFEADALPKDGVRSEIVTVTRRR